MSILRQPSRELSCGGMRTHPQSTSNVSCKTAGYLYYNAEWRASFLPQQGQIFARERHIEHKICVPVDIHDLERHVLTLVAQFPELVPGWNAVLSNRDSKVWLLSLRVKRACKNEGHDLHPSAHREAYLLLRELEVRTENIEYNLCGFFSSL
eukprot:scaffold148_cov371-Prasinococcus_capsulatus_cf.AAC.10